MTSVEDNLAEQTEELMALEAIYGDEICTVDHQGHCCEASFAKKIQKLTVLSTQPHITVSCRSGYPKIRQYC